MKSSELEKYLRLRTNLNQPSTVQDNDSLSPSSEESDADSEVEQKDVVEIPSKNFRKGLKNLRVTRQLKKINTILEGSDMEESSSLSYDFE